MARKTLPQKGVRVVEFLLGLRYRDIAEIMAGRGLDDAELDKGWSLVRGLVAGRATPKPGHDGPQLLAALATWQREHFVILEDTLRRHYPAVHAKVCDRLPRSDGLHNIIAMATLLDRLDEIARPVVEGGMEDGPAALALLAKRGTGPEALASLRASVDRVKSPDFDALDDEIDPDVAAASEQAMWDWYLEWSLQARVAIKDQRMLAALGFRRRGSES